MKADLVLLAMGFVHPVAGVLEAFGVERDHRGNAKAHRRRPRAGRADGVRGPTWRRFRSRRHAPWSIAGGVGDPRRTPVRPRGGRFPDGFIDAAAIGWRVCGFGLNAARELGIQAEFIECR